MSELPETRNSLLAQVRDPANQEAWFRFVEIYRPAIVRIAQAKGLQHADANDLAQRVLSAVAGAIGRWEPDAGTGSFRRWLHRVTRNAVLNALTRGPKDVATGGDEAHDLLADVPQPDARTEEFLVRETRRELYLLAAERVRNEVSESTWAAFERTQLNHEPIDAVAEALGKTPGAIYTARSRVMYRLRSIVREFEKEADDASI